MFRNFNLKIKLKLDKGNNIFKMVNYFKGFTFKFNENKKDLGPITDNLPVSLVKEKFEHLMKIYQTERKLFDNDQKFLIKNLRKYKDIKKSDLPIITEMLAYAHKESELFGEKLDNTIKETNLYKKSDYDIFRSLRDTFNLKLKYENMDLKDFSNIKLSLDNIRGLHSKFFYLLSETLEAYFKYLKEKPNKNLSSDFLESNLKYLKILISLPFAKNMIGEFTNHVLRNQKQNSKFSINLNNFLNSFYYEYDKEVFLKYFLLNEKHTPNPENIDIIVTNTLFCIKEIFQTDLNKLSYDKLKVIDQKISNNLVYLYKNKNLENLNKLYRAISPVKGNSATYFNQIKQLVGIVQSSNEILTDYNTQNQNKETYINFFKNIKNVSEYYAKYYKGYSSFLYTEDEKLKNIFINYHNIFYNTFNGIGSLKLNMKILDKNEVEFVSDILIVFHHMAMNNIPFNHETRLFFISNFHHKKVLPNLNYLTIPSIRNLVYKICIIYINMYALNPDDVVIEENLNFYVEKFLLMFEENKQTDKYFLDLNSILFNILMTSYKEEKLIEKIIYKIREIVKNFGFREGRFLHRLNLITKTLKSIFPEIYQKNIALLSEFQESAENFEQPPNYIWWDKSLDPSNKYTHSEIENYLKNLKGVNTVQVSPLFENMFYTDFLINKNLYIEFLGPFNSLKKNELHLLSENENRESNVVIFSKYLKRQKIVHKSGDYKLVFIPFKEVLEDLRNLDKYLNI
jgi:hypothetical protein